MTQALKGSRVYQASQEAGGILVIQVVLVHLGSWVSLVEMGKRDTREWSVMEDCQGAQASQVPED